MPGKNGQGKKLTRWYKLCFVPSSADSSDDSDTESVVIPIQTSTWEEEEPSPESEPQITWLDPPPPPPPPPLPPLFSIPSSQSIPEHDINWRYPPPPPPPPQWAAAFDIEFQQQPGIYQPPNPRNVVSLDHDPLVSPSEDDQEWEEPSPPDSPLQFFSPEPSPRSQEYRTNWGDPPPPPPSADRIEYLLQVQSIRRVRITELDERDKLSHCPICMEEFKLGEEAYQLPCNHAYRSECILRWLGNTNTCPVCRLQLDG